MYDSDAQKTVVLESSTRDHNKPCKNAQCFNSAFIVRQGRIIYCYDKQFPLPFLETGAPPSWLSFLRGLFFSKQKVSRKIPYSAGTGTGEVTLSLGGSEYHARLALCSDFFCTNNFYTQSFGAPWRALTEGRANRSLSELFAFEKSSPEKSSPEKSCFKKRALENNPLLIVLTHDSWFYGTSVADRMHRYAVLWAIRHQIPVLYVGNHCASWIDRSGGVWSLVTADS
jgi:apolipoprotein N-acyltransferase